MVATRSILNGPVQDCPFCYANNKLEAIEHYPANVPVEQATAYLVLAKEAPNTDDYLVIPARHVTKEYELPDDFTAACKYLRLFIPWIAEASQSPEDPGAAGYHTGFNFGKSAGQTLMHLHMWYSRVPAGCYVAGIATHTRDEVTCQGAYGVSRQDFLDRLADYAP